MSSEPFRRTRRREVAARMWAGSTDDLTKFLAVAKDLQDDAYQRTRARYEASEKTSDRIDFEKQFSFVSDERRAELWQEHRARAIERRFEKLQLNVEVTMKRDEETLTGSPTDVLANLEEPGSTRNMTVMLGNYVPSGYSPPENGFRIAFDSTGARASTYGVEDDWIILTEAKIQKALDRSRPKYAFLRGPAMTWVLPFGCSALVVLILALAGVVKVAGSGPINWPLLVLQFFLTGVTYTVLSAAIRRSIPMFEVYEPGTKARGARNLRRGLTALGVIITAVLIPIALKALGAA